VKSETYYFPDTQTTLRPQEDYQKMRVNTFCVADGITRDPLKIIDFTGHTKEELLASYPNPSSASKAAHLACDAFIANADKGAKQAMVLANQEIANLNEGLEVDYLTNDYAGCTAVGGTIDKGLLKWASIGDCFVTVSRSGKEVFTSPNGIIKWAKYEREHPGDWATPQYRAKVRSQFRNNPDQVVNGVCVSYGALTGENKAEFFIESGQQKLKIGDIILAYSDGFSELVNHPNFLENLQAGKAGFVKWVNTLEQSDPNHFGHEKTLVVFRV